MPLPPTIDRIYSELRQQIINRSMPPGAKLSENSLAKKWKVSRTPIREVLRRLESEGLVTSSRFKGFFVNSISIEDIDHIYTIKISLEGLAGRLATPILSKDTQKLKDLEKLWREMENLSKKPNVDAYGRKNIEFHISIWHWCGNPWLIKILDNLSSQLNRFIVNALHVPSRMDRSVREHRKIVEAFKAGNAKAVEKALGSHFRKASEDLKSELIKESGRGG
jgi:DNA-binding GntR family transcriptional regulator